MTWRELWSRWTGDRATPAAGGAPGHRSEPSADPSFPHRSEASSTLPIHSRAFAEGLAALVPGGTARILDLGPALGSNIEFLGTWADRVQVLDLHRTLAAAGLGRAALERALLDALPEPDTRGWDLVLAWDLLDYLEPALHPPLTDRLTDLVRPGGQLFLLAHYAAEIPAVPRRYRIVDRENLSGTSGPQLRPGPKITQAALARLFSGFETTASYLLKSGLHEMLLTRRRGGPGG